MIRSRRDALCRHVLLRGTTSRGDRGSRDARPCAARRCSSSLRRTPTSYEESLAYTREFIEKWKDHPLIVPAVAPHAPYTCHRELLRALRRTGRGIRRAAADPHRRNGLRSKTAAANRHAGGALARSSIGVLERKVIAAHCVHIDPGEMHTLQRATPAWRTARTSNLKLASGIAPVQQMLNARAARSASAPMARPATTTWTCSRKCGWRRFWPRAHARSDGAAGPTAVADGDDRQGREALHIGDLTGSLESGKRADVIVVDLGRVHNTPHSSATRTLIYSQIVYAARAADVRDVWCNGRC